MDIIINSFLFCLPAIIISSYTLSRKYKKIKFDRKSDIPYVLFTMVNQIGPPFAIYLIYKTNWIIGIVYGIISYLPLIFITIRALYKFDVGPYIGVGSMFLSLISFSIATPIFVLPQLNKQNIISSERSHLTDDLKVSFFRESLSKLQESFSSLQLITDKENKNIEIAITRLLTKIDSTSNVLAKLKNEQIKQKAELDYYKKLSSISREQAEVISYELNKGKYLDYIIGFLIGLASSFTFFGISKVFLTKKDRINSKHDEDNVNAS